MGRCADCASYPWNISFDTSTFTAIKCDERLKAKRWTPASRDAENTCEFFVSKSQVAIEEPKIEVAPVEVPEQITEQVEIPAQEPKKRGGYRKGTR